MKRKNSKQNIKTAKFSVEEMHCAACEVLMKEEIGQLPGVVKVEADADKKQVKVEYKGVKPTTQAINKLIGGFNYTATETDSSDQVDNDHIQIQPLAIVLAVLIIGVFFLLDGFVRAKLEYSSSEGFVSGVFLGFVASMSSCAALVGGLLLSQAKNWGGQRKFLPYLQFNAARLVAFIVFGGVLGLIGSALTLSIEANFVLVVAVSLIMIILGLQMLGFAKGLKIKMPDFIGSKAVGIKNQNSFLAPVLLGGATFFLPCAFTLTAQLRATVAGGFLPGALIMGGFAFGTLPLLLLISFSSKIFVANPKWSAVFLQAAGFVIIVFSIYTINNQMNVVGLPGIVF